MDVQSLAFGLIISSLSIQGQLPVSVSVNGSTITYPILIYHDEVFFGTSTPRLDNINSPGDVICRSENHHRAHWRSPSGRFLVLQNASYKQSVSVAGSLPSLSRLSTPNDGASPKFFGGTNDNVIVNGLWTCQVDNSDISDQDILGSFKYVGIYTRGNGSIGLNINLSLVREISNFMADPPYFTLTSDTSGGPPVNSIWRRNGDVISDGGPYHISLKVNEINTVDLESVSQVLRESRYRSTLTVTGYLPGRYEYSVKNRAMISFTTTGISIQDSRVTDLTAEQSDLTAVRITWTEKPGSGEYDIRVSDGRSLSSYYGGSPYIFMSRVLGVHIIQEIGTRHFPGAKTSVTVKGYGPATMNITLRTSIIFISWSPPEFHLPIVHYIVTLSRVTGQELCPEFVDNRTRVITGATSTSFAYLEEFSAYTVTVTTTFDVFGSNVDEVTPQMMFTTLSAAPTGVPRDVVVVSMTSTSIMVTWDTIECIERNGIILNYTVDSDATGSISGMHFSAEGLTPGRQYTFRVAGMNDDDTGPFTDTMTITTDEEVPGPVSDLRVLAKFTSVDLTWSAPREPNGVIRNYEVTYRVTGTTLTINTTHLSTSFSIPSLSHQTKVSGLSVSAYTKIGRGEAATIPDQITLGNSIVKNIKTKTLSATAVRVSWKNVAIPEITGYIIVYYTWDGIRQNVSVNSSVNSVDIEGLLENVKYHFQVAVLAEVDGGEFIGELALELQELGSCTRDCEIVVSVIFSYFVISVLVTVLLFYWLRVYRLKSRSESVGSSSINQQQTKDLELILM